MLKIIAAGNLGRDAELRRTKNGDPVLTFSLATKHKDTTTWVKCSMWGDRAVKLEPHFKKGTGLTVIGRGGCRAWDKQGEPQAEIQIRVDDFAFHSGGKSNGQQYDQSPVAQSGFEPDSEIPF